MKYYIIIGYYTYLYTHELTFTFDIVLSNNQDMYVPYEMYNVCRYTYAQCHIRQIITGQSTHPLVSELYRIFEHY